MAKKQQLSREDRAYKAFERARKDLDEAKRIVLELDARLAAATANLKKAQDRVTETHALWQKCQPKDEDES